MNHLLAIGYASNVILKRARKQTRATFRDVDQFLDLEQITEDLKPVREDLACVSDLANSDKGERPALYHAKQAVAECQSQLHETLNGLDSEAIVRQNLKELLRLLKAKALVVD